MRVDKRRLFKRLSFLIFAFAVSVALSSQDAVPVGAASPSSTVPSKPSSSSSAPVASTSAANTDYQNIKVIKVVDGDTIEVANGEKVRLIGIDCPESRQNPKLLKDAAKTKKDVQTILAMGKQATAFSKELLLNKNVRLEFDLTPRDRYGRLLAYVYLPDGTFVNARIVQEGYAYLMTIPPNVKFAKFFEKLYVQAREEGKGLWLEELKQARTGTDKEK